MKILNHLTPTKKIYTVRVLLQEIIPATNTQPTGQRLDVEPNGWTKAQGIIMSVLFGVELGSIILNRLPTCPFAKFVWESIDGGHRKRYFKAFYDGEFPLPDGRYYAGLTQEEKDRFLDYELLVCEYEDLSPTEIGYVFHNANKSSSTVHQENINAFNEIPVAKTIRETVRTVKYINNNYHELFEMTDKGQYRYLSFSNKRLVVDEMVARIYCAYYKEHMKFSDKNQFLVKVSEDDLWDMYASNPDEKIMKKLKEKVWKHLSIVNEMRTCSKKKLSKKEFNLYSRMYFYTLENNLKIVNVAEFQEQVQGAYEYINRKYAELPKKYSAPSEYDSKKTYAGHVMDTLNEYKRESMIRHGIDALVKLMKLDDCTISMDYRDFPEQMKREKLAEQKNVCAIDGEPLSWDEAHAGHITAKAHGGKMVYSNFAMIRKCYNWDMGTMNLWDYKRNVFEKKVA